jgi:phage terminase large subunit GpA-like protein
MYYRGEWRATQEFKGIRGYHMNGIYCPWPHQKGYESRLHQMAEDHIRAAKKEKTLQVWINTFLSETWKLASEKIDVVDVLKRCEQYPPEGDLPPGVLVLVASADVQADRIEAEIVGYGIGEESWGIEYRVLMGQTDAEPVWKALDEFFSKRFRHPSGQSLGVAIGVVDMRHKPRHVIKFTRAREGRMIYAVMGAKTAWAPLVSRPKKSTIRNAKVFQIGGDVAKDIIYQRLKLDTVGERYCHFPIGRGYDEEYFRQLVAEKLVLHYENGILKKREWVKQRNRNEALDIRVYNLGALDILNPNWPVLANKLRILDISKPVSECKEVDAKQIETPKPVPLQVPVPQRISRIRRFRRF